MNLDLNLKQSTQIDAGLSRAKETVVNFLVPLICLIVSAALGFLVIMPINRDLPQYTSDLETKSALDERLQKKYSYLSTLGDLKTTVTENAELLEGVLVAEAMVPELLTQVNQITQESGMIVERLTYSFGASSEETDLLYETVTVTLGATGNLEQLITFLTSIEDAARIVDVRTLRYSWGTSTSDTGLDVSLVLTSPFLFVESTAVTDEPLGLDIASSEFISNMNKLRGLRFYHITVDQAVPLIEGTEEIIDETPPESVEGIEATNEPAGFAAPQSFEEAVEAGILLPEQ